MNGDSILAKTHVEPVIEWLVWNEYVGAVVAYNPITDTNRVHVISRIDGIWTSQIATATPADAYDLLANADSYTVGKGTIWRIAEVIEADEQMAIALVRVEGSEKPFQVVKKQYGFWKPYFRTADADEAQMAFEYRGLTGEYLTAPTLALA